MVVIALQRKVRSSFALFVGHDFAGGQPDSDSQSQWKDYSQYQYSVVLS